MTAYDVPALSNKGSSFSSPLGTEARVNWISCEDIGACAAVALAEEGHEGVYDITGPASSTLSAPAMAALLTEELGRTITYTECPPPPVPAYQELWTFLRAGGFDACTGTVEKLLGRPPKDFATYLQNFKEIY